MHVIALYSYESTNLEDLTFNQGDTILLLTKGKAKNVTCR